MSKTKTNKEKGTNNEKGSKRVIIILIAVIILLLLLFGAFVIWMMGDTGEDGTWTPPTFDLTEDENAEEGEREKLSPEEIQEQLNQMVLDGMVTISMNPAPTFETGDAEGNLLIYNNETNLNPQVVEIYRDDTGELIYRSGLIAIGSRVDYAKLDVDLAEGMYPCTAHFYAVDGESGAVKGEACASIVVAVIG